MENQINAGGTASNPEKSAWATLKELVENGIEIIKRPFVISKVKRIYQSAVENVQEQIQDKNLELLQLRGSIAEAIRSSTSGSAQWQKEVEDLLNKQLQLNSELVALKQSEAFLSKEIKEFVGDI